MNAFLRLLLLLQPPTKEKRAIAGLRKNNNNYSLFSLSSPIGPGPQATSQRPHDCVR